MSLYHIIQEVLDYQIYRGESDTNFVKYYFTIHHPIYNGYYERQRQKREEEDKELDYMLTYGLQFHDEWECEIRRGK